MQQDYAPEAWRLFTLSSDAEVLKALMPKVLEELGHPTAVAAKQAEGALAALGENADFQELLRHNPGVAYKLVYALASVLAMRLKRINLKVAELTTTEVTGVSNKSKLEEFASFKKKLMSEWSF